MSEQKLREDLIAAYKTRALAYAEFYRSATEEVGPEKAEIILRRAIHRLGSRGSSKLQEYAPANFQGLKQAFISNIPDEGRLFEPEIINCNQDGLDIKFHRCPLKEAWNELGLGDDFTEKLCQIAGEVDIGLFESAGFAFSAETWREGDDGCCRLHIRAPTAT